MEKEGKILNIAGTVFALWLLALTIALFFLFSQSATKNSAVNNNSTATATPASPVATPTTNTINPSTQLSAFAVDNNGKIFGKYNPEDFASFSGSLVSKINSKIATSSNDYTVLIVSGYLNLKSDITAGANAAFQEEIKYIEIGKNTKIVDDGGNAMTAAELSPEDYLTIIPSDNTEYPGTYMLASQITVTKKVWRAGENPFGN
ncbi:MAG: hypothetical protein M1155_02400 [Patescibacteria group bacterium]|jgi:hypothetical protein|nr:hypothetical protein [Patescibacteria group bacterium]